ncbi:MAG TPA: RCC1 repeat-containing protein, partial [Archangium sp.]|nr:RCC1 repeat-containing protein [Archangium sp.]
MFQDLIRSSLRVVLGGLLLAACGAPPESLPSEEELGTAQAAVCADLTVTSLTMDGASSYEGLLSGGGNWAVSTLANGARLEYRLDGTLISTEDRTNNADTWYVSQSGIRCGLHILEVKAWPMVVDSAGNRTVCLANARSVYKHVRQVCPMVAGGTYHSAALKADGTVQTWGYNYYGQLGDRTVVTRHAPVFVLGLGNVTDLSVGGYHTVALKEDGTVWTWGYNSYGQLGDGTTT